MTNIALAEANKWLAVTAATVHRAKYDKQHVAKHGRIIYNVDFNLLAPLIADVAPVGVPPFNTEDRDVYRTLLKDISDDEKVKLAISEPTVLEAMDLLLHNHARLGEMEGRIADLERRVVDLEQHLETDLPIGKTESIQSELAEVIKGKGIGRDTAKISRSLLQLLKDRKITAIGNLIDKKLITHEKKLYSIFTDIFDKQVSVRGPRDTRDKDNREFHYKVDALNVCITLATAFSPQSRTFFVSGTGLNINLCSMHNLSYGRQPLVPVFLRNALKIDGGSSKESILDEADEFIMYLYKRFGSATQLTERLVKQLAYLKDTFLDPLTGVGYDEEPDISERFVMDSFSTPSDVRKAVEQEKHALVEGAARIADEIKGKITYLERFMIFEDPVVKKIEADLGVSLSHQIN